METLSVWHTAGSDAGVCLPPAVTTKWEPGFISLQLSCGSLSNQIKDQTAMDHGAREVIKKTRKKLRGGE